MRTLPFLLLALVSGCTSGLNRPVTTAMAEPDAQGVQHVRVEMHSFYFKPNRIEVRAGHPVELKVVNSAKLVPHNFNIHDLHVSLGAWLGSAHVRFTPDKPGTYKFSCHVDEHAKKGMTGILVVKP